MNTRTPYNLIFSCSGACDVGAIADHAARQLSEDYNAMFCTSAVAAGVPAALERTAKAARIVAIDGCDQACARKILTEAGFCYCAAVELDELGLEKGKSPATDENVARVVEAARLALNGEVVAAG